MVADLWQSGPVEGDLQHRSRSYRKSDLCILHSSLEVWKESVDDASLGCHGL